MTGADVQTVLMPATTSQQTGLHSFFMPTTLPYAKLRADSWTKKADETGFTAASRWEFSSPGLPSNLMTSMCEAKHVMIFMHAQALLTHEGSDMLQCQSSLQFQCNHWVTVEPCVAGDEKLRLWSWGMSKVVSRQNLMSCTCGAVITSK